MMLELKTRGPMTLSSSAKNSKTTEMQVKLGTIFHVGWCTGNTASQKKKIKKSFQHKSFRLKQKKRKMAERSKNKNKRKRSFLVNFFTLSHKTS